MRVDARVEQLDVYSYFISSPLHAAFEHSGHAELASYCLQVFRRAFIFGCRFSRDNLQVADASEFRQDFILNAVGKICVRFFFAQVLEWENSDAFLQKWRNIGMKASEKQGRDDEQQDRDDKKIKFATGLARDRFANIDIFCAFDSFRG